MTGRPNIYKLGSAFDNVTILIEYIPLPIHLSQQICLYLVPFTRYCEFL